MICFFDCFECDTFLKNYITAYVIGSESTGIIKCELSAKKSKLSALKKAKNIVVKSLKTNDQFQ